MDRAGKTEVLTDDLQAADKHVEQIRAALTGLNKRLGNLPNQTVTQEAFKEKRLVNKWFTSKDSDNYLQKSRISKHIQHRFHCGLLLQCQAILRLLPLL